MKTKTSKKVLVTGGTGFIGSHLLWSLKKDGYRATSVSLGPPKRQRFVEDVEYLYFDLTSKLDAKKKLNRPFDFVVNFNLLCHYSIWNYCSCTKIRLYINTPFTWQIFSCLISTNIVFAFFWVDLTHSIPPIFCLLSELPFPSLLHINDDNSSYWYSGHFALKDNKHHRYLPNHPTPIRYIVCI